MLSFYFNKQFPCEGYNLLCNAAKYLFIYFSLLAEENILCSIVFEVTYLLMRL